MRNSLVFIGLGLILWVIYLTVSKDRPASTSPTGQPEVTSAPAAVPDSINRQPGSTPAQSDSLLTGGPASAPANFHVVLEISGRKRALKRFADLTSWKHNVRMATQDSVWFKIYTPVAKPLSDTTYYKDSLRIFYNRKVWIEIPRP